MVEIIYELCLSESLICDAFVLYVYPEIGKSTFKYYTTLLLVDLSMFNVRIPPIYMIYIKHG